MRCVGRVVVVGLGLAVAARGWAAEPDTAALLDSARAAILRGGYVDARKLLDDAERAATTSPTPVRTDDVARLSYYRGVVEWYAGNRDEASLRHWRAAAGESPDLQPDAELLPDSQARDVYYALRSEVRGGESVALGLPEDTMIFVDGRRGEPDTTVPVGRHLVQVRCPAGGLASAWHDFGAPPADYLVVCSGGTYAPTAPTTPDPADPAELACPTMTSVELGEWVARGREALFTEDLAAVAAVDTELQKRLPCMHDVLVEPEQWAPHLVTLSIAAYARNLDWQTPLASALAALPNVPRGVGPGHPVGAWVAPPLAPATRTAPPGVEVYVDGRRLSYLPPLSGPHLVQIRDGKQFRTRYLPNGEGDSPWDELLGPFLQDAPPSVPMVTTKAPGRGHGLRVGMVVGGAVLAAGGGGLFAYASTEEQALLADEGQLRQWALAGETAESVEDDPAVKRVNTLYASGYVAAGAGLLLGAFGFVLPLSVTSLDGAPALVYSGAW